MHRLPSRPREHALRQEIRTAALESSLLRATLLGYDWLLRGVGVPLLAVGLVHTPAGTPAASLESLLWAVPTAGGLALVIASFCGRPAAAAYRALQRARIRRELAGLSEERAAELLVPLANDPFPETRLLVEPLARPFRRFDRELSPAAFPSSGKEPLPAAECPDL